MSEISNKNVVSILEEHVEHAISTVKTLRDQKLELEAEIARLSSDLMQRDAKIQELESEISELKETSELARQASEDERAGIRAQLEGLMQGLAEPDGNEVDVVEESENSENEVTFSRKNDV
ncbi:hypothetical protein JT359_04065 [Candidatus Poribacteria bacterium]|nr:hypothetical protein [Candidatus Poribacteria bacterium]